MPRITNFHSHTYNINILLKLKNIIGKSNRWAAWFIAVATALSLYVSIVCLLSGWLIIFQNLFYIPIIIACIRYTWSGFYYSIGLACFYFLLMFVFSGDPSILLQALIRVVIFIIVAGVIADLSYMGIKAEKSLREERDHLEELVLARTVRLEAEVETSLKAQEEITSLLTKKDLLLKEVHHRVKNNLQVISSLLRLQLPYIRDELDRNYLLDTFNRVFSMALIHDILYRSEDFNHIDMAHYLKTLVSNVSRSYLHDEHVVRSYVICNGVFLEIDTAISCGLLVVELILNSIKRTLSSGRLSTLKVEMAENDDEVRLSVEDDGVGQSFNNDQLDHESLSYKLIEALCQQIKGRLEFSRESFFRAAIFFTKP